MGYLLPAEYEAYGLAVETADALVRAASGLMEAHCRRPSLMAASYTERVRLTAGRQVARLSYGPVVAGAVTAARVRYGVARRGEECLSQPGEFQYAVATAFALPGSWTAIEPATVDLDVGAREVWFGTGVLGLPYNEAEITYTAGFVTVPDQIKTACAQVVKNAQATPALNVSRSKLDTMQLQYFGPTLIDADVRMMLKPYVAEKIQ